MTHSVALTDDPIDCGRVLSSVETTKAGAVVLFLGTVREFTLGRQTAYLEYEAYRPMAEGKTAELIEEAAERWTILKATVVHRLGRMELGDASVAVAVSSPHRPDAFEAGRFLIDRLKEVVPIWKQEHYADGEVEWVHPTTDAPQ